MRRITLVSLVTASILLNLTAAGLATPQQPILWVFGELPEALALEAEHEVVRKSGDLSAALPRAVAQPGERWLEVLVAVHPQQAAADGTELRVSVWPVDGPADAATAALTQRPAQGWGADQPAGRALLRVDLRTLELPRARLRLELWQQAQGNRQARFITAEEFFVGAAGPAMDWSSDRRVPIAIDIPQGAEQASQVAVTFSLPLPAGSIWDADAVRLVDASGIEIPSQRQITATWAKQGSAKWIRFDAVVARDAEVFVEPVRSRQAQPAVPLQVTQDADGRIVLDTGSARYILGTGRSPIHRIERQGTAVATAGPRGLYVVDQNGRVATASPDSEVRIEARGPLAASVRFEGDYRTEEGEPLARHITRVEAFAGQPEARVTHTFILSRNTNDIWFREVGWEFDVETGADPQAIFGTSREGFARSAAVPLEGHRAAYLFQEDHVQFHGGENRFVVAVKTKTGEVSVLEQGEEMGDWAALVGASAGLSLTCRESARQHPKELLVEPGRISLKLFSSRAGEELDFRPAALAARWNRGGMLVETQSGRFLPRDESLVPIVEQTPTNAQGWSKTHQLAITPVDPQAAAKESILAAVINTAQVFALADPWWLYETRVLGPLYPRNRDRFPIAEDFIEQAIAPFIPRAYERDQEYGFVDYFAGPHYRSMGTWRYTTTYAIRPSAWLMYARSGDRAMREWVDGTTRTYTDGVMTHAEDPDDPEFRRVPGLYTSTGPRIMSVAPYYWGDRPARYHGDGGASNSILTMQYHLAGYRRAADVMELHAQGLTRDWEPGGPTGTYPERLMRNIANAYVHTWDPKLRIMLDHYLTRFYDPKSTVFVNKQIKKGQFPGHKSAEHTYIPVKLYELTGDRRFYNIALALGEANYYGYSLGASSLGSRMGFSPMRGRFERGRVVQFIYEQTGRNHMAEEMLTAVHMSIPGESSSMSSINWDMQGVIYGLSMIAQQDADRQSVASWVAFDDSRTEGTIRVIARKNPLEQLDLRAYRIDRVLPLGNAQNRFHRIEGQPPRITRILIPSDSSGGDYELGVSGQGGSVPIVAYGGGATYLTNEGRSRGYTFVYSDTRHPLVLYAQGEWQPAPVIAIDHPVIYFRVPEDAASPRIHFAGSAALIAPDGLPWAGGEPVSGWFELPQPGMWGFKPVANKPVRVENVPPFFAFRDPAYHFIPPTTRLPDPPSFSDSDDDDDDD